MTDTPLIIKKLQLKVWLSKTPMERLKKMMEDNDAMLQFWKTMRKPDMGFPEKKPTDNSSQSI